MWLNTAKRPTPSVSVRLSCSEHKLNKQARGAVHPGLACCFVLGVGRKGQRHAVVAVLLDQGLQPNRGY